MRRSGSRCRPAGDGGLDRRVVGIPSLRIKGIYLAIATLAAQFDHRVDDQPRTVDLRRHEASIQVPPPAVFGMKLVTPAQIYLFLLFFVVLAIVGDAEPDPQPDRPRLHRHPRPGHRRRDHRHQHLPLQAVGIRDLLVLRRRHRRAVHLLSRHRELRAVRARRLDQLTWRWSSSAGSARCWARSSARLSSPCCRSSRVFLSIVAA